MAGIGWFFLDTPVPWLAAMCLAAYRHDLSRLFRRFSDHAGPMDWRAVCDFLKLTPKEVKPAQDHFRRFLPGVLLICSSGIISCIDSSQVLFRQPWYWSLALQAVAAVPLFVFVLVYWAGPFPFRPYRDALPYPRLGTRVRHLGGRKEPNADGDEAPSREDGSTTSGGSP